MIRRPPRSTLFPTRRSSDLGLRVYARSTSIPRVFAGLGTAILSTPQGVMSRSEEHTSELQSHLNLVCRLLLEKNKTAEPEPAPARPPHRHPPLHQPAPRQTP